MRRGGGGGVGGEEGSEEGGEGRCEEWGDWRVC